MPLDFYKLVGAGSEPSSDQSRQPSSEPAWLESLNQFSNRGNAFGSLAPDAKLDYSQNSAMQQTAAGGTTLNKQEHELPVGYKNADDSKKTEANAFEKALHGFSQVAGGALQKTTEDIGGVGGQVASTALSKVVPAVGTESLYSFARGRDLSQMDEQGYLPGYEMTGTERVGALVSGVVDTAGIGAGGSGTLIGATLGRGAKKAAEAVAKSSGKELGVAAKLATGTQGKGIMGKLAEEQKWGAGKIFASKLTWDSLEEGGEEFVQSIAEDARFDNLDSGTLGRAAEAGLYGAAVGGVFSAAGQGVNYLADRGSRKLNAGDLDDDIAGNGEPVKGDRSPFNPVRNSLQSDAAQRYGKKQLGTANEQKYSTSATVSGSDHSLALDQLMEGDENFKASWDVTSKEDKQTLLDLMFSGATDLHGQPITVEGMDEVMELKGPARADKLNEMLDRSQKFYMVTNYKNPQVTQASGIYQDHAGFYTGTGIRVNPMVASLSNADIDGDMRQRIIHNNQLRDGSIKANTDGYYIDATAFFTDGFQEGVGGGYDWKVMDQYSMVPEEDLPKIRERIYYNVLRSEGMNWLPDWVAEVVADVFAGTVGEPSKYWSKEAPGWTWSADQDNQEKRRNAAMQRLRSTLLNDSMSDEEAHTITNALARVIADAFNTSTEQDIQILIALSLGATEENMKAIQKQISGNPAGEGAEKANTYQGNRDTRHTSIITDPWYVVTWMQKSPSEILADQALRDAAGIKYTLIKDSKAYQNFMSQFAPGSSAIMKVCEDLGIDAQGHEVENEVNSLFTAAVKYGANINLAMGGYHTGLSTRQLNRETSETFMESWVDSWNEEAPLYNEAIKTSEYQRVYESAFGRKPEEKKVLLKGDKLADSAAMVIINTMGDQRIGDHMPGVFEEFMIGNTSITQDSTWNDVVYALSKYRNFPTGAFVGPFGPHMQPLFKALHYRASGAGEVSASSMRSRIEKLPKFDSIEAVADPGRWDEFFELFQWLSEVLGGDIIAYEQIPTVQSFMENQHTRAFVLAKSPEERQNILLALKLRYKFRNYDIHRGELETYVKQYEPDKKNGTAKQKPSDYDQKVEQLHTKMMKALRAEDDGSFLWKQVMNTAQGAFENKHMDVRQEGKLRDMLVSLDNTLDEKQQVVNSFAQAQGGPNAKPMQLLAYAVDDAVYGEGSTKSDRLKLADMHDANRRTTVRNSEKIYANNIADALGTGESSEKKITIDLIRKVNSGSDSLLQAETSVALAAAATTTVAHEAEKGQVRQEQVSWAAEMVQHIWGKAYNSITQWQSASQGEISIEDLTTNRKVFLDMVLYGKRFSVYSNGKRFPSKSLDSKIGTEEFMTIIMGKYDSGWVGSDDCITEAGLSALLREHPMYASFLSPSSTRIDYMSGSNEPVAKPSRDVSLFDAINDYNQNQNKYDLMIELNSVAGVVLNNPAWLQMFLETVPVDPDTVSDHEFYKACLNAWPKFLNDWHGLLKLTGTERQEALDQIYSKLSISGIAQYARSISDTLEAARIYGNNGYANVNTIFQNVDMGVYLADQDALESVNKFKANLVAAANKDLKYFEKMLDKMKSESSEPGDLVHLMADELKKRLRGEFNMAAAEINNLADAMTKNVQLTQILIANVGKAAYDAHIARQPMASTLEEKFMRHISNAIAGKVAQSNVDNMIWIDDVLNWNKDEIQSDKMKELVRKVYAKNDSFYAGRGLKDFEKKWDEIAANYADDADFRYQVREYVNQVNRLPMDCIHNDFAARNGLGVHSGVFADVADMYQAFREITSQWDQMRADHVVEPLQKPGSTDSKHLFTTWNLANPSMARVAASGKNYPITASIAASIGVNGGFAMKMQGIACLPNDNVCEREPVAISREQYDPELHNRCHYRYPQASGRNPNEMHEITELKDIDTIFANGGGYIEIYPRNQACTCGGCCANHSSGSNIMRSGMHSELFSVIMNVLGTTQEAMNLKRKKLAAFDRKVINAASDFGENNTMTLKLGEGPITKEQLLASYDSHIENMAKRMYKCFEADNADGLSERDAQVLANSMGCCITYRWTDGKVRTVSINDFISQDSEMNNPDLQGPWAHMTANGERITASMVLENPDTEISIMPIGLEELNDKICNDINEYLKLYPQARTDVGLVQKIAVNSISHFDNYLMSGNEATELMQSHAAIMTPLPYQRANGTHIIRASSESARATWNRLHGDGLPLRSRDRRKLPHATPLESALDPRELESLDNFDQRHAGVIPIAGATFYYTGITRLDGKNRKMDGFANDWDNYKPASHTDGKPVLRKGQGMGLHVVDGSPEAVEQWLSNVSNLQTIAQVESIAIPTSAAEKILMAGDFSMSTPIQIDGVNYMLMTSTTAISQYSELLDVYNETLDVIGFDKDSELTVRIADRTHAFLLGDSESIGNAAVFEYNKVSIDNIEPQDITKMLPLQLRRGHNKDILAVADSNFDYQEFSSDIQSQVKGGRPSKYRLIYPDLKEAGIQMDQDVMKDRIKAFAANPEDSFDKQTHALSGEVLNNYPIGWIVIETDSTDTVDVMPVFAHSTRAQAFEVSEWSLSGNTSRLRLRADVISLEELKDNPYGLASKTIIHRGNEDYDKRRSHDYDDHIEQVLYTEYSSFAGKLKGRLPWLRVVNMYYAAKAMPTSIKRTLDPATGTWKLNENVNQDLIDIINTDVQGTSKARETWSAIANGTQTVFIGGRDIDATLNEAMQVIARQVIRHWPSVTGQQLFESHNFDQSGNPTTFRKACLAEPYNIYGFLNSKQLAAFFHELNPNICSQTADPTKQDPSAYWINVCTGEIKNSIADANGENRVASWSLGYIGPHSVWMKRQGLGEPAHSATLGLQSAMNSAWKHGLTQSNIDDIVGAIEMRAANPHWWDRVAMETAKSRHANPSYIEPYDPKADIETMKWLDTAETADYDDAVQHNRENYQGVRWILTVPRRIRENKKLDIATSREVAAINEKLARSLGFNEKLDVNTLMYIAQHIFGWSWNNGHCVHEYTLDQFEAAINKFIKNFQEDPTRWPLHGDDGSDMHPVLAAVPEEVARVIWNRAGEGSNFQLAYGGDYQVFKNAMKAEQDIADKRYQNLVSSSQSNMDKARRDSQRSALMMASEYALKSLGFDPPSKINAGFTTGAWRKINNPIITELLNEDDRAYYERTKAEHDQALKHFNYLEQRKRDKKSIHYATELARGGETVAAAQQPSQQASRIGKTIEAIARMNACAALGMMPGSLVEGGTRIAMMKAGFKMWSLVGHPQRVIHTENISKVAAMREFKSVYRAMQEGSLLGYGNELSQGIPKDTDINTWLETLKDRNTGQNQQGISGKINSSINKGMKFVNCEKMFTQKQAEIAIERFAQMVEDHDLIDMKRLEKWTNPETGEVVEITRFELGLITNPVELISEIMAPDSPSRPYWMSAMNAANTTSMSRETVASIAMQQLFKRYGGLSMLNTCFGSPFYRFALNKTDKLMNMVMPLSSLNYLLVNELKNNPDWEGMGIQRAQIHSSLAQALAADAVKMSAPMLAAVLVCLSGCLGAPDDDDLKADWREYTIFGCRVRDIAWWTEDLLSGPLIMATFWKSIQDGRPNLALFTNGVADMCYDNPFVPVAEIVDMIVNPQAASTDWAGDTDQWINKNGGKPTDFESAATLAGLSAMNSISNMFIPSLAKSLYRSDAISPYELSYKRVWSDSAVQDGTARSDGSFSEQDTVSVSYQEAMARKFALKNPMMALFFDTLNPTSTTAYSRPGFFWKAAPVRVQYSDPEMRYYANKYSVMEQDEQGNWVNKPDEQCFEAAYNVLAILEQYDDMAELRSKGFAINSQTQYYTAQVLQNVIDDNKDQFYSWYNSEAADAYVLGEGNYQAGRKQRQDAYTAWQSHQDYLYALKDKLYSDEVNKGVQYYWRENTDYAKDDSGNWYATGNVSHAGFGQQMIPFPLARGTVSDPQGTAGYAGQYAALSAVNGSSTGERGLVPISKTEYPEKVKARESSKQSGYPSATGSKSPTYAKRTTYGGYRSYAGGGSSGGGSTRIYSTMPTSRFSNPDNMNVTRLYGASYDYLRPAFETKGSREAYKREDF